VVTARYCQVKLKLRHPSALSADTFIKIRTEEKISHSREKKKEKDIITTRKIGYEARGL